MPKECHMKAGYVAPQIAFTGCIDTWQPVRLRQTGLHDRKACWATYPNHQCSANQFCTMLITLHVCGEFDANVCTEEKLNAMNCDKSAAVWQQEKEPPAVCQPLLLLLTREQTL